MPWFVYWLEVGTSNQALVFYTYMYQIKYPSGQLVPDLFLQDCKLSKETDLSESSNKL